MDSLIAVLRIARRYTLAISLTAGLLIALGIVAARPLNDVFARICGVSGLHYFTPIEPIELLFKCGMYTLFSGAMLLAGTVVALLTPTLSRKARAWFIGTNLAMVALGMGFGLLIVLPVMTDFMRRIAFPFMQPMISAVSVMELSFTFMLLTAATFQTPFVILALSALGLVNADKLRSGRKYVIVVMVTLIAIITPTTDALSLCVVSLPYILLYEASTLMIDIKERRHGRARPGSAA